MTHYQANQGYMDEPRNYQANAGAYMQEHGHANQGYVDDSRRQAPVGTAVVQRPDLNQGNQMHPHHTDLIEDMAEDDPYKEFDEDDEEALTRQQKCVVCLKHNVLLFMLVVAIIVGVGMGIGIRVNHPKFGLNPRNRMYFEFPGELLMRMLKMCILPLIISSLISGMASLPQQSAGKLGGRAVLYYLITTFMAVLLGILLVSTIKPGVDRDAISDDLKTDKDTKSHPVDPLLDLIRNAFPNNLVSACFISTRTTYPPKEYVNRAAYDGCMCKVSADFTMDNKTCGDDPDAPSSGPCLHGGICSVKADNVTHECKCKNGYRGSNCELDANRPKVNTGGGTDVLGIVVFSIVLGVIIGRMGEKGKPLRAFFNSLEGGIIRIVRLVIWYAPIGIAFLLAGRIIGMEDPIKAFQQLAWYMMTVIVGLVIHGFIFLPIIYFAFTRKNPFKLMFKVGEALVTALGTASSSATLPITLKCLITKARIDTRIAEFVLPVGATINMDGTALYEAVAAIFIAQYNGIPLNAAKIITISITATAAAIGAAGVPEAGLVTMLIVLEAAGLPTQDIALIVSVDWFLDRLRTTLNVWGDCVGGGVVAHLSRADLKKMDAEEAEKRALDHNAQLHPAYLNAQQSATKL